jgi:histone-lysine N-methyltransferase SETD1
MPLTGQTNSRSRDDELPSLSIQIPSPIHQTLNGAYVNTTSSSSARSRSSSSDLSRGAVGGILGSTKMSSSSVAGTSNHNAILTPITTTSDLSPPDKPIMLSPGPNKRSFDQMLGKVDPQSPRASLPPPQPSFSRRDYADSTLTPTQTPPESSRQPRPGPGEIKGYKLVFDPETAPGLDARDRRKMKPKYNAFGDKVRRAASGLGL